jgi:hypothetical protein
MLSFAEYESMLGESRILMKDSLAHAIHQARCMLKKPRKL